MRPSVHVQRGPLCSPLFYFKSSARATLREHAGIYSIRPLGRSTATLLTTLACARTLAGAHPGTCCAALRLAAALRVCPEIVKLSPRNLEASEHMEHRRRASEGSDEVWHASDACNTARAHMEASHVSTDRVDGPHETTPTPYRRHNPVAFMFDDVALPVLACTFCHPLTSI